MSISQTQITAFYDSMSGLAQQAGAALGVDPAVILAQWANESAYGTSNLATKNNNFAGITQKGVEGQWASYSSPTQFEQAYVSLIQRNFPAAENTGANTQAFVTGLTKGPGGASYIGTESADSYASKLASIEGNFPNSNASLTGEMGGPYGSMALGSKGTQATGGLSGAASKTATGQGPQGGVADYFGLSGSWTEMGISIAFVLGGLLLIATSIYLLKTTGAGAITVSVQALHGTLKNG